MKSKYYRLSFQNRTYLIEISLSNNVKSFKEFQENTFKE